MFSLFATSNYRWGEKNSPTWRRMGFHCITPLIIVLSLLAAGCSHLAKEPLETETYQTVPEGERRNLIVFIRALYGNHKTFEKEGFVAMVRAKGLSYDMVAPNAHMAYYYGRTLDKRLREDVIEPARAAGYTNIWLVGVSMGGLGSILYLLNYPEDSGIAGIVLMAPFLGEREILHEIILAGGLRKWEPGDYGDNDWQRLLWDWLKRYDQQQNHLPPIYLGYGDDDAYALGQGLLAAILPSNQVVLIEGTHSVDTVKEIWAIMLDTVPFQNP
ncbi:MAG: alpha/beta hydrolase [Desulfobacterales bacterium]